MKNPLFIGHISALFLGGMIYILFRDSSILLFGWIEHLGAGPLVEMIQIQTVPIGKMFPQWVLFSLPDGLWLFSYVCLALYIWRDELTKYTLIWVIILPIMAVLHELAQWAHFFVGTFDPFDLLFYCIAALLPFVLFRKRINLVETHNQHEK